MSSINVGRLSDSELEHLRREVQREQAARRVADTSPERIQETISQYQKSLGRAPGDPWSQPTHALDSYLEGDLVTHDGQLWRSTVGANVFAPGQSGWRLEPETDEHGNVVPPPYVAPSGSHDSYQEGERITWSDGLVYEAVRSGVVHSPDEYAADWRLIEPEPEPEPDEPEEDDEDTGDDEDEPVEPEPEPEPDPETPAWEPGVSYTAGEMLAYQGETYKVLQAHTSAAHWPPDQVASLYERQ